MFELPVIGYAYSALEPYIDTKTMEIHHSKHHQAYVTNLNNAVKGTPFENLSLDQILTSLDKMPDSIRTTVRNNAGGHANHSLFWQLLKNPQTKPSEPSAEFKKELQGVFGSYDKFVELFKAAAMGRFGSGWAWLVIKDSKLSIMSTANQDSPLMEGFTPLLGVDVWEHAYYLKHQNLRASWLEDFFKVINWEKVEELYRKSN